MTLKPHLCKLCGVTAPELFYKTSKSTCKSCASAKITERYHNDPSARERIRAQAAQWQEDNMFRFRINSASSRAKRKGIECSLTVAALEKLWEDCSGNCYYTGLPMSLSKSESGESLSIDRLDSSLGYTLDNVVLCRSVCNAMKNDMSTEVFASMVLALSAWAQKISAPPI